MSGKKLEVESVFETVYQSLVKNDRLAIDTLMEWLDEKMDAEDSESIGFLCEEVLHMLRYCSSYYNCAEWTIALTLDTMCRGYSSHHEVKELREILDQVEDIFFPLTLRATKINRRRRTK